MVEKKNLKEQPIERRWVPCPVCGTKLAIADNTTKCSNLYIKCRTCKNEIKVDI